ncbi:MAG: sigma-70 family RNA polymerase sigma factor [Clostridia bacterium]|nr:sigma-70 family RNA polymerase sigma factor [Clostridia bacterium]
MEDKNKFFEEVISKYSDMVYRIALNRVGNKETAEDVFQEVFLSFSKKCPKFSSEEHEKAWFIKVTINKTKNIVSSKWNKTTTSLEEDIPFETQEKHDIYYLVQDLPRDYRTVIYLFYYEGYKVKEIGDLIGKNENTVKTWLARARDSLKKKMEGGIENG